MLERVVIVTVTIDRIAAARRPCCVILNAPDRRKYRTSLKFKGCLPQLPPPYKVPLPVYLYCGAYCLGIYYCMHTAYAYVMYFWCYRCKAILAATLRLG